jgi:hypothetical protein
MTITSKSGFSFSPSSSSSSRSKRPKSKHQVDPIPIPEPEQEVFTPYSLLDTLKTNLEEALDQEEDKGFSQSYREPPKQIPSKGSPTAPRSPQLPVPFHPPVYHEHCPRHQNSI